MGFQFQKLRPCLLLSGLSVGAVHTSCVHMDHQNEDGMLHFKEMADAEESFWNVTVFSLKFT